MRNYFFAMYYYIMIIDFYCGGPLGWDWDEIGKCRGLEIRDEKGPRRFFFFFATFSFSLSLSPIPIILGQRGEESAIFPPKEKKKAFSFPYQPQPQPQPPQTRLPFYLVHGIKHAKEFFFFFFNLSGISLLFYMQAPKKSFFPPAPGPQSQRKNMIRSNFAPQKRQRRKKKNGLACKLLPALPAIPPPIPAFNHPWIFVYLFIYFCLFWFVWKWFHSNLGK